MDAGGDDLIAGALSVLEDQDPRAAALAGEAFDRITGGFGAELVTQAGIQHFLWVDLPLKWPGDCAGKLEVAGSLGRALRLLELPRYAAICESSLTERVLAAYEVSGRRGLAAFRRAAEASGVAPPAVPGMGWSAAMGPAEACVWAGVSLMLEQAVARGDLVVGRRGWRGRQQAMTLEFLQSAQSGAGGQTPAQLVFAERVACWARSRRSATRGAALAQVSGLLLDPAEFGAQVPVDALPLLRWLLECFTGGVALTRNGNLNRRFVQEHAARFGWKAERPPRSEAEVWELLLLRRYCQRLKLAHRRGSRLALTPDGQVLLAAPRELCRAVSASLLAGGDFGVFTAELLFALLLAAGPATSRGLVTVIAQAAREEGFCGAGQPVSESAVWWAIHETSVLCQALGVLASDYREGDMIYSLTPAGTVIAADALRMTALCPRTAREE